MVSCESKLDRHIALEQGGREGLEDCKLPEISEVQSEEADEVSEGDNVSDEELELVCCECLHNTRGHSRELGDH